MRKSLFFGGLSEGKSELSSLIGPGTTFPGMLTWFMVLCSMPSPEMTRTFLMEMEGSQRKPALHFPWRIH